MKSCQIVSTVNEWGKTVAGSIRQAISAALCKIRKPLCVSKKCQTTWGTGERSIQIGADCDCRIPTGDLVVAVIGFCATVLFLGKWMAWRSVMKKRGKEDCH